MIAFALLSAALAQEAKVLTVKVSAPGGAVVYEATLNLPAETVETRVELGGLPYVVQVVTNNRHDTVAVEAIVYQLHGKKEKRVEVVHPKLILYEDYPGHIVQPMEVPRDWAGTPPAPFEWTLDAVWDSPSP